MIIFYNVMADLSRKKVKKWKRKNYYIIYVYYLQGGIFIVSIITTMLNNRWAQDTGICSHEKGGKFTKMKTTNANTTSTTLTFKNRGTVYVRVEPYNSMKNGNFKTYTVQVKK